MVDLGMRERGILWTAQLQQAPLGSRDAALKHVDALRINN